MKKNSRALPYLLPIALASLVPFSGCSSYPYSKKGLPRNRAFIAYWPPASDNGQLTLAVKDNIDMRGVVTTAGSELLSKTYPPAKRDAACLAGARQGGVQIVGKANLTEFAVAPSGFNEYFGTPKNPQSRWKRLVPGGSSCGSAVAVASGMADVALGTDTAGSIRVPAAFCGIVGLKTTKGLVPMKGVYPIEAKHLDTVGPMGKDIENTARGMDLLQSGFASKYNAAKAAKPSARSIRVGRLRLAGTNPEIDRAVDAALTRAGFQVVELDGTLRKKWEQAKDDGNTVAAAGAWMSNQKLSSSPGISATTKTAILAGRIAYNTKYDEALARQARWKRTLQGVFKKVDFIALPTTQTGPPPVPPNLKIAVLEAAMLNLQNTVPVNFAGNPALAVPIPLERRRAPVTSLQLIGPRLSEAQLLNAGRLVEAAVKD